MVLFQLLVYLLLLLFSIPLLTPDEDQVSKALVFFIFFMCRHIGEYISLELFCLVLQPIKSVNPESI